MSAPVSKKTTSSVKRAPRPKAAKPAAKPSAKSATTLPAPSVDPELERLRAMLSMLYDNNPDSVCFSDSSGALFMNPAAQQMMNLPQTGPNTIADGLLTSTGTLTWPVIRDVVDRVFTATEPEIVAAMRLGDMRSCSGNRAS